MIIDETADPLRLPRILPPLSYLSAPIAVCLMAILQNTLLPDPSMAPFVFFFPAVSVVSLMGGFLPGLLAVVLSALVGNYLFIGSWSWSLSFQEIAATSFFIVSSIILILLSVSFRKLFYNFKRAVDERQKAETDVRRANEMWDRTFDGISDLTFIQDKDFRIVKVNRAFAEKLKLKPEEIVGKKCFEVLHKSGKPWASCPFEKTRIDKKPHTEEVIDPGIGLPLLVTTSPIFSRAGEFLGSIHIAKDITELKRAEESLRREMVKAEVLLSSIGDGIVAVDVTGSILFVNQAFIDLVKKGRAELLNKNVEAAVSLEDEKGRPLPRGLSPIYLALTKGRKISLDFFSPTFYLRQKDNLAPLAITAAPVILDGATIGAIAVFRDISKEKAVDQAKTEFVSLASHQLRTPLSSIALSIELLLRGASGEISPEQRKYLSEAYNSTKIMAELIKVLLDISRIELGTLVVQPEPINLAESLNNLLDELKLQLDSKRMILKKHYAVAPIIQFDKNILRTTVENLVTNAIRYTPDGGTIAVSLEKNDHHEILLKIADNGCGIAEKDQTRIFSKLFRADNAKSISSEGAGLGLYLVKSLLIKIGSHIWFESELNKGTTFFVAIPVNGKKG